MSSAAIPPQGTRYSSVDEYLAARKALVAAERSQSFTGGAQSSPTEAKASAILAKLKRWDEETLHTMHPDGTGFELGHRFLNGLDTIASSKILEIAKAAPKGALLHCHLDAMLHPQPILEDARSKDNLFIKTDAPLTCKGFFDAALPTALVLAPQDAAAAASNSCFSPAYVAGTYMPYSAFLAQFPGGRSKAEAWICSKIVLSADGAYHPEQTVDGIWAQFKRSFLALRGFINYESAYAAHFRRLLWHFARDGIAYAEIRAPMGHTNFVHRDDASGTQTHLETLQMLAAILADEVPKIQAAGLTFWGVRFIYGSYRLVEKPDMRWMMDDCIAIKQALPDLLCGFDLQGQEDDGHSHLHFIHELLDFRRRCDDLGLDLPFIFHAGETLDHGGDTDSNLFDAILLGTKRIGHGFSLTKHPLLMQLCKERNIAIETCPISNEVLGLSPSGIRNHPLPTLLAHCVPCTVNTDDPGFWEASMSHDFYQVMVGSDVMDLVGWRVLAEWSFEYSCMEKEEKERALKVFAEKWETFCAWIVETYEKQVN